MEPRLGDYCRLGFRRELTASAPCGGANGFLLKKGKGEARGNRQEVFEAFSSLNGLVMTDMVLSSIRFWWFILVTDRKSVV